MEKNTFSLVLAFLAMCSVVYCKDQLLVDQLRLDFLDIEEKLWKYVLWEASYQNPEDSELYLVKHFNEFDQKLQQMPENILRGLQPIKNIHAFLYLYSEMKNTENLYEKFRRYQEDQKTLNNEEKLDKKHLNRKVATEDIITDILNEKNGANITVYNIYNLTFGKENMALGVYEEIIHDYDCKNNFQSPQQVFYNLYNTIALNGLKSYMMLQFAYLSSRIEDKENYTELSLLARTNFENRVNETMSVFRGAMEIAPKTSWRCDPKTHLKGQTYEELTRLLQGHIQNEVDMNPSGTCRENCAAYPFTKSHGCYDYESKYCREMERCSGSLIGCRFVESDMSICVSQSPSRRYDYIQYGSGTIMGKKAQCWKKPVESWYRWFVHCSYCMCICDQQGSKSDRYISLRPVMADVKNNRVVTGLKLTKYNRIIHLQIQEGKLLPFGYIANNTVHWVPVDNFNITDAGVFSGEDYFTLTYETRSLALDLVKVEEQNLVVTGVRFQYKDGKLRFHIVASPFDWDTGIVQQSYQYFYKQHGGRSEIDLSNADIPTKSPPSELNYNSNLYVKFTHTDFDMDAAQTTIPYFDAQPIYNEPQVPLMGAGLHYKGQRGYGGFIAPKIMSYDFSQHVLIEFKKPKERNQQNTTEGIDKN